MAIKKTTLLCFIFNVIWMEKKMTNQYMSYINFAFCWYITFIETIYNVKYEKKNNFMEMLRQKKVIFKFHALKLNQSWRFFIFSILGVKIPKYTYYCFHIFTFKRWRQQHVLLKKIHLHVLKMTKNIIFSFQIENSPAAVPPPHTHTQKMCTFVKLL